MDPVTNPIAIGARYNDDDYNPDVMEPIPWNEMKYGSKIKGLDDVMPTVGVEHSAKFGDAEKAH